MPEPHDLSPLPLKQLVDLCQRCHVRRLWLFGSLARGEARPDSDADFLVDFDDEFPANAFTWFFDLAEGLERLTGRKVDLLSRSAIRNQRLKVRIEAEKRALYAA